MQPGSRTLKISACASCSTSINSALAGRAIYSMVVLRAWRLGKSLSCRRASCARTGVSKTHWPSETATNGLFINKNNLAIFRCGPGSQALLGLVSQKTLLNP